MEENIRTLFKMSLKQNYLKQTFWYGLKGINAFPIFPQGQWRTLNTTVNSLAI